MATVYILKAEGKDLFKIGQTGGNVQDRIKSIQTGCPYRLPVWMTIPTKEPDRLERILHSRLAGYRVKGEWFEIDSNDLTYIMNHQEYDGPFYLEGDDKSTTINLSEWVTKNNGKISVSPNCVTDSELEHEVYSLVDSLLGLLRKKKPKG